MSLPSSVEEAGAELGAAITLIGLTNAPSSSALKCTTPPSGMHSSFSTYPISTMELFLKLKALLHQLQLEHDQYQKNLEDYNKDRLKDKNEKKKSFIEDPLRAAPSILAVLLKLLSFTSSNMSALGSAGTNSNSGSVTGLNLGSIRRTSSGTALSRSNHSHHGAPSSKSLHSSSSSNSLSSPFPPTLNPPLLSTAIRNIWVQCVTYCLIMGDLGKGRSRIDIYEFTRKMMTIASFNPKSVKASGGARLGALQVISSLFKTPSLTKKLSPWALEIFSICLSGIRSAGSNDPTHRLYSIELGCSLLYACRTSVAPEKNYKTFLFHSAMEEKALLEAIKVLKKAGEDRFPEVRMKAAEMAGLIGNVALFVQSEANKSSSRGISMNSNGGGRNGGPTSQSGSGGSKLGQNPFIHLEDIVLFIMKNLDDECPGVADKWTEALARCFCVTIAYGAYIRENHQLERSSNRNVEGDDDAGDSGGGKSTGGSSGSKNGGNGGKNGSLTTGKSNKFMSKLKNYSENRRLSSTCATCSSLSSCLQFLVDTFIKVGGELGASKCGGAFSAGGRAVRLGISKATIHLIRLQTECGEIGQEVSYSEVIDLVLKMVGPDMQMQLPPAESLLSIRPIKVTQQQSQSPLMRYTKIKSPCDPGLVRLYAGDILRSGLGELSSEMAQLSILHDLAAFCSNASGEDTNTIPNSHQLQVVLVEMSHLIAALGESSASAMPDILKILTICLSHKDHGVRYEACNVYASLTCSNPEKGTFFLTSCLEEIKRLRQSVLELPEQSNTPEQPTQAAPSPRVRLRRGIAPSGKVEKLDKSELLQCSLHGNALAVSMILLQLPFLPCGVKSNLLDDLICTAECLIMSVFDEGLVKKSPVSASTCVRSGYFMLSSAMTIGSQAIKKHVKLLFHLWKQSRNLLESPHDSLNKYHQLICLEGFVASIVTFLRSCSNFLLSVPHALSEVSVILEKVLDEVAVGGNFSKKPKSSSGIFFWKHLQVLVMEAFCWLPPGSFPLAADKLFVFTAEHIKMSTASDVSTSLLPHLVSREDCLLDAYPSCRATFAGQVTASKLENSLLTLTFDPAVPIERETTLHSEGWKKLHDTDKIELSMNGSKILGMLNKEKGKNPPTPLHKIGTWQEPSTSNLCVKTRVIDFAIQAFAASFGSQDNSEKEKVGKMFEIMMASTQQSGSRVFSNALMSENEKNNVKRQEVAIASNISATILACVKSLPFYEAYIDDKIRVGSPWMTKTADVLFSLLPSSIYLVRRAAAEGLASLAVVGLSENKHSVQSSILHSLDEVMQGNQPDGTLRKIQRELLISSRSGVLLALACIQRSINSLLVDVENRSRERSHAVDNTSISPPPTLIMMTRVLACLSTTIYEGDSMTVRVSALHSYGLLISYSFSTAQFKPGEEHSQILRKAIELIEFNFFSSWTTSTLLVEKGSKEEKFEKEPVLLAVLIRLMTSLLDKLHFLEESDPDIRNRFCAMVGTMMKFSRFHSAVIFEGMAFYETFSTQEKFLNEETLFQRKLFDHCLSYLSTNQGRPSILVEYDNFHSHSLFETTNQVRATILCLTSILKFHNSQNIVKHNLHVSLFCMLESCVGKIRYENTARYKHIAVGRDLQIPKLHLLKRDIISAIQSCMSLDISSDNKNNEKRLLHWLLFSRIMASGNIGKEKSQDMLASITEGTLTRESIEGVARSMAEKDALAVLSFLSPNRWQVKLQAMKLAIELISQISSLEEIACDSPHFDPIKARKYCIKQCKDWNKTKGEAELKDLPPSYVSLHLEELISTACVTSVITSDQSELRTLQALGIQFLIKLILLFARAIDPDDNASIVLQQFSSQIVSSVKHSIETTPKELQNEVATTLDDSLFLSGCKALELVIKNGLVTDSIVLKRLIRPLLFPEIDICRFPKSANDLLGIKLRPSHLHENAQIVLSQRLGSLNVISELWLSSSIGAVQRSVGNVIVKESKAIENFCAIHSGALALDAALLIHIEMTEAKKDKENQSNESGGKDNMKESEGNWGGLIFSNSKDVGETFTTSLKENWPKLIAFAIFLFSNHFKESETNEVKKEDIISWLVELVPLLFTSLHECISSLDGQKKIDNMTFSVHCLRNLIPLLSTFMANEEGFQDEFSFILYNILKKVIIPKLETTETKISTTKMEANLVDETCALFGDLCESHGSGQLRKMLIKIIFQPLNLWQEGLIPNQVNKEEKYKIMSSFLRSARTLVSCARKETTTDDLLKATVHVTINMLLEKHDDKNAHDSFTDAATLLLKECTMKPTLSKEFKQRIANEAARIGSWDAWATICTNLGDDSGILCSIETIRGALINIEDTVCHSSALKGLRVAAQEKNSFIVSIMTNVGGCVINLLRLHGISSITCDANVARTTIYADAMRITMLTMQQLMSPGNKDDDIQVFLELLFDVLVEIIEYNGLPNNLKTNSMSDPAIGRMCAQAILHAVKSCPIPSKATIALMKVEKRSALEFAVRAEMTGYGAPATSGPAKKKLSLKKFTKV